MISCPPKRGVRTACGERLCASSFSATKESTFKMSLLCLIFTRNCLMEVTLAFQSHTLQLVHTGNVGSGEWKPTDGDNLVAGSWPTMDNSSRLNRHTGSALQPSAATLGVWCKPPPYDIGPGPGPAWSQFRCLLCMMSTLNEGQVMHHPICRLGEAKPQPDSQL